ncbi:site-specific integrase [Streptomyces termitum]|uniref:Integrase n=1 Tax=Streptomyces termitum TaxID=67368 RepID=A0A918T9F6_9ACTN|nr:site-specific integrase [Streptomyces termitum]GHB10446.1 integrase [Streptomyces termitum]
MWDRWSVEFYDFLKPPPSLGEGMLGGFGDLHDRAARNGAQHGTPVLVTVSGFADPGVNLFFRVSPMKGRGARTWKRYAYTLVVWLNFLRVFGKGWREATARDVEAFKDWRLTDVRNDDRIKAVSFDTDRAALNTFYTWAWGKYGVQNPVSGVALASSSGGRSRQGVGPGGERRDGFRPAGSRGRQVKWMLRAPFEQWRDIGLRGYGFDGLRRAGWSGPNEDRDAVFVDGLYGTGLRLQEWGSVLDVEIPRSAGGRLPRAWLAAACVKGAKEGRWYRIPRAVLREIEGYADPLEGSRTQAVRRAQRRGTYERISYKRVVRGYNARNRLLYLESGGSLSVDVLGPDERRLLFRRTASGLEPLALWLSPNGMPKKFEGWEDTFTAANERIQRVWAQAGGEGLVPLWCRPHMCRHSFALKWYSLLSTVWQPQLDGFTEQELLDIREMFGGVWYALSLMLGHVDPSTTRETYLEPFTALQVDYLMELLDSEETQAVEVLIRTVAEQGGRTLTGVARPGAHVQMGGRA